MSSIYRIVRIESGALQLCSGEKRGDCHYDTRRREWVRSEGAVELARFESLDALCECALRAKGISRTYDPDADLVEMFERLEELTEDTDWWSEALHGRENALSFLCGVCCEVVEVEPQFVEEGTTLYCSQGHANAFSLHTDEEYSGACEWRGGGAGRVWETQCGTAVSSPLAEQNDKFCRFCGKRIEFHETEGGENE